MSSFREVPAESRRLSPNFKGFITAADVLEQKKKKKAPAKKALPTEIEMETQISEMDQSTEEDPQKLLSSEEEDSECDEEVFRDEVKDLFQRHGVSIVSSWFELEKKKFAAKQRPTKKQKVSK